jgi:uncharacterized protein (DUF1330 family)
VPKAYRVACYRKISDPAKLAAYAKLAGPAIEAAGGHFLARANAVHAFEAGKLKRTVIIEFESIGNVPPAVRAADQYLKFTRKCAVLETPSPHCAFAIGSGFFTMILNLPAR